MVFALVGDSTITKYCPVEEEADFAFVAALFFVATRLITHS
jgi:hypothetical protein